MEEGEFSEELLELFKAGLRVELHRVLDELREHRPGCARLEPLGCAEANLRGLLERL